MDGTDNGRGARRRGTWVKAGDALPERWRAFEHTWERLVGATLADATVLSGLSDDGRLRVMAMNDAARREVEARAHHIIASWNAVARSLGARLAGELVCWVRPGLVKRRRPTLEAPPPPPIGADALAQAEAEVAGVADPALRAALARARARALESQATRGGAGDSFGGNGKGSRR